MRALLLAALLAPAASLADESPIQDNSFLVEEAYNQEEGVVQHINTFQRTRGTGEWIYTFTQEWPVGGITHQLSYTVPILRPEGSRSGVGDIALNYRYQLFGDGEARVAMAPRFSVIVPSGKEEEDAAWAPRATRPTGRSASSSRRRGSRTRTRATPGRRTRRMASATRRICAHGTWARASSGWRRIAST
jgi:hypothetical protein